MAVYNCNINRATIDRAFWTADFSRHMRRAHETDEELFAWVKYSVLSCVPKKPGPEGDHIMPVWGGAYVQDFAITAAGRVCKR